MNEWKNSERQEVRKQFRYMSLFELLELEKELEPDTMQEDEWFSAVASKYPFDSIWENYRNLQGVIKEQDKRIGILLNIIREKIPTIEVDIDEYIEDKMKGD